MKSMLSFCGFVLFLVAFAGCDGTEPAGPSATTMAPGSIEGTVAHESGSISDLGGTQVLLYRSDVPTNAQIPVQAAITDEGGYFKINEVCCGHYTVIGWKDNDADGAVDSGDFYSLKTALSSCQCTVEAGKSVCVCAVMGTLK